MQLTTPMSPMLQTKLRTHNHNIEDPEPKSMVFKVRVYNDKVTEFHSFSIGNDKSRFLLKMNGILLPCQNHDSHMKARALPKASYPFTPRLSQKELTDPVPFKLSTSERTRSKLGESQGEYSYTSFLNNVSYCAKVDGNESLKPKLTSPHSPRLATKLRANSGLRDL